MNRLASANWGSILTNSEPEKEIINPVIASEEDPEEDFVQMIQGLEFNDYAQFGLDNPEVVE